jgi:hypothetical protein
MRKESLTTVPIFGRIRTLVLFSVENFANIHLHQGMARRQYLADRQPVRDDMWKDLFPNNDDQVQSCKARRGVLAWQLPVVNYTGCNEPSE